MIDENILIALKALAYSEKKSVSRFVNDLVKKVITRTLNKKNKGVLL